MNSSRHGHAQKAKAPCSATYRSWSHMLSRCRDRNSDRYRWYGARGIKVCERWLSFSKFLADMGERPEGRTLDRIDTNGDYELSNCRWATQIEQTRNSRSNRVIILEGKRRTLCELAKEIGIKRETLAWRLNRGQSLE